MIRSGPSRITDGVITLREITPADSELLYRLRFLDETARTMFRTTEVVPFPQHQQRIDQYFSAENTDRWFVVEREGLPIGMVALVLMSESGTEYECGRLIIIPQQRGSGLAIRVLDLVLEYCRESGITRLRAEVLEHNEPSLRSFRRAGFHEAGSYVYEERKLVKLERVVDR